MLGKLFFFLKIDLLEAMSYKLSFIFSILGIFFSSATFFFISKLIPNSGSAPIAPYGGDYFSFVMVGLVFSELLGVFESTFPGKIRQAQVSGTLESLFMTRTSFSTILIGLTIYPFIFTLFRIVFYFILGLLVFGLKFGAINWPAAILIFFFGSICFLSIGILSASFILVYKMGNPLSWVFGTVSGLLGGVFFPISVLPGWLKWLSYILPITHALEGARKSMLVSSSFSSIMPNIITLAVFGAIFFPISLYLFQLAVKKAKKQGVLAQY